MKAARLVVLVIALGAGGVAALLAGRSEKPTPPPPMPVKAETVDILIAKTDIALGQPLNPADIEWQSWPATTTGANFIRKTDRANAIEVLSGYVARVPFVAGEPIREAKLVNPKGAGFMAAILPAGSRAVSTQISPETGAGGFILPNDRVDVIVTKKDRNAAKSAADDGMVSETVLNDVRVLAIDQLLEEKGGQKVVIGKTATLELTSPQAETLALAQRTGTISLALRSIADAGRQQSKTEPDESRGGISVVRFGVSSPASAR
jgi:pilus assembly protein CpaB